VEGEAQLVAQVAHQEVHQRQALRLAVVVHWWGAINGAINGQGRYSKEGCHQRSSGVGGTAQEQGLHCMGWP
jgi:hypothetical protein